MNNYLVARIKKGMISYLDGDSNEFLHIRDEGSFEFSESLAKMIVSPSNPYLQEEREDGAYFFLILSTEEFWEQFQ